MCLVSWVIPAKGEFEVITIVWRPSGKPANLRTVRHPDLQILLEILE
jgi:hypothetical protein